MLFLTEANEKYTDELEQFKNEVLICDKDNEDQFAGCAGLRNCNTAKEWIEICNLRKSAETCEQAEHRFRQRPISLSEKVTADLSA